MTRPWLSGPILVRTQLRLGCVPYARLPYEADECLMDQGRSRILSPTESIAMSAGQSAACLDTAGAPSSYINTTNKKGGTLPHTMHV